MQFENILFPVDFSTQAADVSPTVKAMAKTFNARLTLLNVVDLPPVWYGESDRALRYGDVSLEEVRQFCLRGLDEFRLRHFHDIDAKVVQVEGDPAVMIRRHIETNPTDLVMMPTHGHGPFRLALLGSVTAKVLHDVACPVWTSCHAEARIADPACCETIVCAVDTSEDSVAIMKAAASLALRFTAKLILVHAVGFGSTPIDSGPGHKSPESEEGQIRARLDSLQRLAGVKVPICMGHGHTEEVVCDAVQRQHANLVIIGRGHHREEKNLFRSRVYWIVRESPCPVLSI